MKKPKQPKAKSAGKARKAPRSAPVAAAAKPTRTAERDPRLPAVGTTIVRPYKGKEVRVKVLADGFEYEGTRYRSLTGIAKVVCGYVAISGPHFFRMDGRVTATPKPAKTKPKSAAPAETVAEPASFAPVGNV